MNLTTFNLASNGFSVTHSITRLAADQFKFCVVIFNLDERIAFEIETTREKAASFASRVFDKGVVNLTLWNSSTFCYYTEQSDIDDGYTDALQYSAEPFGLRTATMR